MSPRLAAGALVALAACAIPEPDRPVPPPEIRRFEAVPFQVEPGSATTVVWRVTGAVDRVLIELPDAPPHAGAPEGQLSLRPAADAELRLRAEGPGGARTARAVIRVGQPVPARIERFTVTPTVTRPGDPLRIAWSTRGSSRVTLLRDRLPIEEALPAAGARILRPERSTRYELRVEGLGGPLIREIEVRVGVPPPIIVGFEASPPEVEANRPVTLAWTVIGAERVRVARVGDDGRLAVLLDERPPSTERLNLTEGPGRARFRLTAENAGGTATATATLQVVELGRPLIDAFTLTPTVTGAGGEARLEWTVRQAEAVTLQIDDGRREPVSPVGARPLTVDTSDRRARLVAVGGGRTAVDELPLRLDPERPRVLDFGVTPARSAPGEPVTVVWATEGAERLRVEDDLGATLLDDLAARGFAEIRPQGPVTLRLVAESARGRTARSLPLTVGPRPAIDRFEVLEPSFRRGRAVRFAWSTRRGQAWFLSAPGRPWLDLDAATGRVARRVAAPSPGAPDLAVFRVTSDLFSATATLALPALPPSGGVVEEEPNDGPSLAHEASPGLFFEGTLRPGDRDSLVVEGFGPERLRVSPRCASTALALVIAPLDPEGWPRSRSIRIDPLPCGGVLEAELATLAPSLLLTVEGAVAVETSYRLDLELRPAVCGDGVVDRDEACDDGDLDPGDGCDPRCEAEGLDEVEPNGAAATASPLSSGVTTGFLGPTDEDWFRLAVSAAEVGPWSFTLSSPGGGCEQDVVLELVDAAGRARAAAGGDGLGCPRLEPPGSVLGVGTWYLRLTPGAGARLPPRGFYRLTSAPPP